MRVWLIGENNPYGRNPEFDLYCEPERSAGGRLQRGILGMKKEDYLREFNRRNLLRQEKWSIPAARAAAKELRTQMTPDDRVILLGRKVHDAWCSEPGNWANWFPFHEYQMEGTGEHILHFPHPSGLCRIWNQGYAIGQARKAVVQFAPHLADLVGAVSI